MTGSVYQRLVLPRLIALAMGAGRLAPYRVRTAGRARGMVLEIGCGAGANFRHYGPTAFAVRAVEPPADLRRRAEREADAIDRPIELIDAVAENLPVPDASIDTIVLTWTLCSLDDAPAALAEMRRVLRPGGALLFCEHGLAPDAAVARWQRRLTPAWRRIAGNCHLDRDVPGLLDAAGFRLDEVETGYLGGPRPLTWMTSGLARPAG